MDFNNSPLKGHKKYKCIILEWLEDKSNEKCYQTAKQKLGQLRGSQKNNIDKYHCLTEEF